MVSIAQLGARLRAHVDPAAGEPLTLVRDALHQANLGNSAQVVEPTLEDVFMAVTR